MLRHCGGLPLAVFVLGGLVSEKQTLDEWVKLHENVKELINIGKSVGEHEYKGVLGVLGLSYDELPYQLKPCFLHLANFPEDSEINVKELCRLWTAEGFVLDENEAHKCLIALVYRGMVQVGKRSSIVERIKTCRMHDLMRDLCLERNKNFLSLINFQEAEGSGVPIQRILTSKVRRLAVYSNENIVSQLLPLTNNRDGCLRSLMCFAPKQDLRNPKDLFKPLFNCFYMLRVLKFENILTSKTRKIFPKEIGRLVQLRFLSLRNCLPEYKLQSSSSDMTVVPTEVVRSSSENLQSSSENLRSSSNNFLSRFEMVRNSMPAYRLPSSMANLTCLQTLDLRGDAFFMTVEGLISINIVIPKLDHLRHLYLPIVWDILNSDFKKSFHLRLGNLTSLETLVNFDTIYCKLDDLSKLTKLTKLGIRTQKDLGEIKHASNLQSLDLFKYTKSEEDIEPFLSSYLGIQKLNLNATLESLKENILSPNLVKVILVDTRLKKDPMPILGKLSKLRILAFFSNSYDGMTMVCCKDSFPQLKSLSIQWLGKLEEWRVEEGALSKLCHLKMIDCSALKSYPDELRNITTLMEIEIERMPEDFQRSYQNCGDEDCHDENKSAD